MAYYLTDEEVEKMLFEFSKKLYDEVIENVKLIPADSVEELHDSLEIGMGEIGEHHFQLAQSVSNFLNMYNK